MKVADAVAVAGHEVHVCRYREARTLLRWLGEDLRGLRVLDVAAGDGYWAARTRERGARAVALDLDKAKLSRGRQLSDPPALVRSDALQLPFEIVIHIDGRLVYCHTPYRTPPRRYRAWAHGARTPSTPSDPGHMAGLKLA